MKLLSLFSAILTLTVVATPVHADEWHSSDLVFRGFIDLAEKQGFDKFEFETTLVEPTHANELLEIAKSQSGIWADTILEGDYEADGATVLDNIEEVKHEGQVVAYRITYSEGAWYVGSCDYDWEDKSKLAACTSGRIAESTFVSPSLKSWTRDWNSYAEFYD